MSRPSFPTDHEERMVRLRVSLDGLAVGDAFGQQFFYHPELLPTRTLPTPRWHYTDDAVMALGVAGSCEGVQVKLRDRAAARPHGTRLAWRRLCVEHESLNVACKQRTTGELHAVRLRNSSHARSRHKAPACTVVEAGNNSLQFPCIVRDVQGRKESDAMRLFITSAAAFLAASSMLNAAETSGFTDADFTRHLQRLRKKTPAGFHILVQKPFVVVGDEDRKTVERRAVRTIKWAVDHLKAEYFEKDPEHIIDVWLFKDRASYLKHTKDIFNDEPTTPYGYYSSTHKALIMNISTGGGTLVHEIVHPFIASNFPDCPSWFNEGLASLYEQCGEKDGRIHGYTNWRLRGLKEAIEKGRVPPFKDLMTTTRSQFYDDDRGTNYAQSRYLCYYLQERGLLVKFYREFNRTVADDPTGYRSLQKVLCERDVPAFQKRWEKFVEGLK